MAEFGEEVGSKAGGGLKKKIGPLELWQWGAATLGVVFAYLAYRNHVANSAGAPSSAPATNTSLPGTGASPTDLGTTISGQLTNLTGQVGQLQNQVAGLGTGGTPTVQSSNGFSSDVTNLYGLVGRSPDTAGAAYWQNVIDTQGLSNAVNQFAATPEAQSYAASNPQGFVNAEYSTVLGRTAEPAGLSYWQGRLSTAGPAQEAKAFTSSATQGH